MNENLMRAMLMEMMEDKDTAALKLELAVLKRVGEQIMGLISKSSDDDLKLKCFEIYKELMVKNPFEAP